jgi:glycosyltransferase involved in cell wall biosynthesis
VFVCASEHEGFCLPIAQAMAVGVPVVAFAAAAVPETMGGAGLLVHDWDVPRVGELVRLLLTEPDLRARVVAAQRASLDRLRSPRRADASARSSSTCEPVCRARSSNPQPTLTLTA